MHKILLFVDDILLFIRNLLSSIPAVMQCLRNYVGRNVNTVFVSTRSTGAHLHNL